MGFLLFSYSLEVNCALPFAERGIACEPKIELSITNYLSCSLHGHLLPLLQLNIEEQTPGQEGGGKLLGSSSNFIRIFGFLLHTSSLNY